MPTETAPPPESQQAVSQLTGAAKEIMKRAEAAKTESFVDKMAGHFETQFPEAKGGRPAGHPVNEPPPEPPAKTDDEAPKGDTKPDKPDTKATKADTKPPIPEKLLNPDAAKPDVDTEKEISDATKGLTPKARENFKVLSEKAKAAEKRIAELEGEITKAKAVPKADPAEIEALKKQNQELDETVKRIALEHHPKFKSYYDGGKEDLINTAKTIVGDKLAKEVESLLRNSEPTSEAFDKLAEEVGSYKASQIAAVAANITKLDTERRKQLDNWKSGWAELQKQESEQAQHRQAALVKAMETAAEKAIKSANGEIVFKEAEGETEWNAEVQSRRDEIRRIAREDLNPDDKAQLAMQAVVGIKYRELFHHQVQYMRKLQAEIAELRGAQPNPNDSTGGGSTVTGAEDNSNFIDSIVKRAANDGLLQG